MSKYKIIVRSPGWQAFEACTLGVSVNSPNWQDEYFASILEFAAAHFKTIRIDVTDALHRHNFIAEALSGPDAATRAEGLGSLWLARHQPIIDASAVTPNVIRWSQWYKHPDYVEVFDGFTRAARTDPMLHDAIERDVDEFLKRQGRESIEEKRRHSRDYLIEELAVFTLQARSLSSLKIYPGNEPACINVVRRGLVAEAPRGLEREQYAKIKFHTRGLAAAAEIFSNARPVAPRPPALSNEGMAQAVPELVLK